MKELTVMLERKYPGSTNSHFYRSQAWKWNRQLADIERIKWRKPEAYERAIVALVDWIGKHALAEDAADKSISTTARNARKRRFMEDLSNGT